MKIKSIVTATAVALYSYGVATVAHAAQSNSSPNTLQGISVPQNVLQKQQSAGKLMPGTNVPMAVEKGAVNRHLQPLTPEVKFQPEEGITGVQTYIVRLRDQPVATYDGRVSGYKATSLRGAGSNNKTANSGEYKLYSKSSNNLGAIESYKGYLLGKQDGFVQKAASSGVSLTPRERYTNALNGMSVKMTQEEAIRLAQLSDVLHIQRSEMMELLTDVGPQHIGADQIWSGEATQGVPYQGEGMVVGIIDTGVNTDHMSFADVGGDGYDHTNPWGEGVYVGDCTVAGQESMCNDKLIGVRSYPVITDTYDADEYQDPNKPDWDPNELLAPKNGEDYQGHGSHVASTAAGNVIFDAPLVQPQPGNGDGYETGFTFDRISGVAPHANIVSYQVCYAGGAFNGCPEEAILAAIEDAIEDGVDAINFSIGGLENFAWEDATELAFLAAREAGINVSVAAGNAGGWYISHTAPWESVVAASNHGREISIDGKSLSGMTGGDSTPPTTITGAGISAEYTANIVLASNFGDELCATPFPAGTFTNGEIVACKRGDLARVVKADNVLAGGAGGFVLYNADSWGDEANLVNDIYPLPGVHINKYDGDDLVSWLASGAGHNATITASEINTSINPDKVDTIADFSSRGPSRTMRNTIVPNFAAPGEQVWAAYADEHPFAQYPASSDWAMLGGTSMASPHVAGSLALMQQAHPDWTPSEIQSALQMTATPAKPKMSSWGEVQQLSHYDAGTGIINVANAVKAGLIMDETAQNFMDANPNNGGDPRNMNLPQVLDMNCKQTCTWVRTVEATVDGTWDITTETSEYSVKLRAYPEQFSLKAGEIQTVMIQGEVLDSQNRLHGSELEVHGKIHLTPQDTSIPSVMWPAALRFDHGALPEMVNIVAHRNDGKEVLGNMQSEAIQNFTSRVYQATQANIHEFSLPQDDDTWSPINDGLVEDSDHVIWLDVPAGSKRLMAEVLEQVSSNAVNPWEKGVAGMLVGIDSNEDGIVQPQEESICWSNAAYESNWCNINNPDQGKYWVLIHNFPNYDWDSEIPTDTYRVATGVVSGEMDSDITVTGPASTDGLTPYAIDIDWNLNDFVKGDIIYSAFDLGTDPGNPGSIGFVPMRIERGVNEVSIETSQTRANPNDILDLKVKVLANQTGVDRGFELSSVLPEGMTLIPGSVSVLGTMDTQANEDGNSFSVTGNQLNSSDWAREYVMTTNVDDMSCKTPDFGGPSDGGYVNLNDFNIYPSFGGDFTQNVEIPYSYLWYGDTEFALYNNEEYAASSSIFVSPMGYVKLEEMDLFWPVHLPFPFHSFPDQLIGVMWKGAFSGDGSSLGVPLNAHPDDELNSGISFATTQNKDLIIEWDNARSETYTGYDWETGETFFDADREDSYDFEMILNLTQRYNKGDFELIMAYDNIDFGITDGDGSIGLQGYHGPRSWFSPLYGYQGTEFAYNDLKDKLHDDLVICYDYRGPESTQMEIDFQVRVDEDATGQDLVVEVLSSVDGLNIQSITQVIEVPTNLKVGAINDQMVEEDASLEGIMVAYSDSNTGANTISVSADNVTATVNGHTSGSTIDLTPATDFSGQTLVTVTVADNLYPTDSHSTSFMLTVTPTGDAPVAMVASANITITEGSSATLDASSSYDPDGDALTFSWDGPGTITDATAASTSVSGLSVGSHTFTVTVSDGMTSVEETVTVQVNAQASTGGGSGSGGSGGSGGGAFGWLMLAFLGVFFRQRKVSRA